VIGNAPASSTQQQVVLELKASISHVSLLAKGVQAPPLYWQVNGGIIAELQQYRRAVNSKVAAVAIDAL
jgi:hypothetical protein